MPCSSESATTVFAMEEHGKGVCVLLKEILLL